MKKQLITCLALGLTLIAVFQLGSGLKIASKAWLSQFLIEHAWARTLSGEMQVRPWPWADTWPVAELNIPSLDLKQIVLNGDNGSALAFGPGLNDYKDEGLDLDFTIVSGHRDTHFSKLRHLRLDDILELRDRDGSSQHYQVLETKVVNENWVFPQVSSELEHLLILSTCYPLDAVLAGTDKRLLVFAAPVDSQVQLSYTKNGLQEPVSSILQTAGFTARQG